MACYCFVVSKNGRSIFNSACWWVSHKDRWFFCFYVKLAFEVDSRSLLSLKKKCHLQTHDADLAFTCTEFLEEPCVSEQALTTRSLEILCSCLATWALRYLRVLFTPNWFTPPVFLSAQMCSTNQCLVK